MSDPVTYKELWEYLADADVHDTEAIYNTLMDVLFKLKNKEKTEAELQYEGIGTI